MGGAVQGELELAVHGIGDVVRRAVAHQDDRRSPLLQVGREAVHEDPGHAVAVGHAVEVGDPQLDLFEPVLALERGEGIDDVPHLVVLLARDDVGGHDVDVGEALVVHFRQSLDRCRDLDVLLAGDLPADDVGREGQTHLRVGEGLFGAVDEVVDGLPRLGHGGPERGDQDARPVGVLLVMRAGERCGCSKKNHERHKSKQGFHHHSFSSPTIASSSVQQDAGHKKRHALLVVSRPFTAPFTCKGVRPRKHHFPSTCERDILTSPHPPPPPSRRTFFNGPSSG